MNRRDEVMERIKKTPMFSHSAMRLIEVTNDPDHILLDVVKIIEADSVLTAQVFKVVNSAAFGFSGSITSVSRAVALLGDKTIVGLAIGHSQSQIYGTRLEGYDAEAGALWEHSLRTAIAARELVPYSIKKVLPEIAYTAGILHDIGKAIVADFLSGQTEKIVALTDQSQSGNFLDAERDILGVDHCEAGYALAQQWKFPEVFQMVCKHHHYPANTEEEHRSLAYVVHIGDIVAMMGGSGTGADALLYTMDPDYQSYLKMGPDDLNKVMMNVMIEFERTKGMVFD